MKGRDAHTGPSSKAALMLAAMAGFPAPTRPSTTMTAQPANAATNASASATTAARPPCGVDAIGEAGGRLGWSARVTRRRGVTVREYQTHDRAVTLLAFDLEPASMDLDE